MTKRKVGEVWTSEVTEQPAVLIGQSEQIIDQTAAEAVDMVADAIIGTLGEDLVTVVAVGVSREGGVYLSGAQLAAGDPSIRKALRRALALGLEQI